MKRKLLLADDSVTIQKVVNLTFADEGIDVITVGDGNSAMAKISESAPDLILADVHMPGLSGYQVCEMVRSNEATKELPVVLLVGSFEPFDENEAARVGANAFLTKPFQSIRQLVSQVSDLMRTSAPASEPASEVPQATSGDNAFETTGGYAPDATGGNADETSGQYPTPAEDVEIKGAPKIRDTTDIDNLYLQSVGGTTGDSDAETGPPRYVDAGMDDEMIETVHAAPEVAEEEPAEDFYQEPTAEYHQPADEFQQPQPTDDYQQPADELQHTQPTDDYQQPTGGYQLETTGYQQPVGEYEQPVADYQQPVTDYQQPVDEYREPTAEYHEPAAQYEQPAESVFQDEAQSAPSPFDSPADETPAVASPVFDETNPLDPYSSTQSIPHAAPTGEFSLDDVNLLELPPIPGGQSIEFTTNPEGGKQVVSLSPELMDALVEKVVKQLSKKE